MTIWSNLYHMTPIEHFVEQMPTVGGPVRKHLFNPLNAAQSFSSCPDVALSKVSVLPVSSHTPSRTKTRTPSQAQQRALCLLQVAAILFALQEP